MIVINFNEQQALMCWCSIMVQLYAILHERLGTMPSPSVRSNLYDFVKKETIFLRSFILVR
jgi:hypothetical protein